MDTMNGGELDRPLMERSVIKEGFMKYLVAYEFLERVALRGVQTVLALYLLESLHFNEEVATELVHFFLLGSFISPIIGSFVSDVFTGNYTACYLFSYCELLGHIILTTSAIPVDSWQCSRFNHALVPFALFMVVLGSGALKPCQVTFGGDQMDQYVQNKYDRSNFIGGKKRRASHEFFSAYYMAMNLGTLLSAVVAPILRVQGHGNYFYAFLMPACSMALCIFSFWLGRGHYYYRPAPKLVAVSESSTQSALADAGRGTPIGNALEKHTGATEKACYLQDVKDTLYLLAVIIPCPLFTAMFFQTSSTWVFQARSMDGHVSWLGGFTIQPDQMPALNPILVVLIIPLMDNFVYPFVEKYIVVLPNLKRMVLAMVTASLAFVASGFLQMIIESDIQAKQATGLHDNVIAQTDISVLWQIPQYILLSLAETLMFIPAIDWGYAEAPESTKTVVQAALHVSSAIGNLITIAVVAIMGTGGSKVTESFVFAGLGAFATGMMTFLSYTYVTKDTRAARRRESQAQ